MIRPRCYLDIEIDDEPAGRIIIELYKETCPITCENFRALCTGERGFGKTTKKPLCYKNTLIHRVVKSFVIQSGDFEKGNGTGGESIYGGQFNDENFKISHEKPYLLSMANKGPNTNGSQFFITLQPSPHLDGIHTVFGEVIAGQEVIQQIEAERTDEDRKPLRDIRIAECGELVLRSEKRKRKDSRDSKDSTSSSESSSSEEERRRRRKHKKEKKKNKREKKAQGFYSSNKKPEDDIACNVDPDEIPAIPANRFLMRRTSPVAEFRRTPRGRENYKFQRAPPSRTRSGRKVKGRGNMRYRTPSASDEKSGSETPPHWKQEQSRLKKLKEVVKEKEKKDKNSDSEVSNEENERIPFLESRLGLVSSRNFEDERRKERDARININENRRRRDFSQGSSKYNQNEDEPEDFFEKLRQENDRHGNSWFHENNQDQSDEETHSSPLRSKVVVKSSVSRRDSRDNRREYVRGERDYHKRDRDRRGRDNENTKRRDSPSDKRSRTFHRDPSSNQDDSYRKSNYHNENKNEINKNLADKKNEKPKHVKRLNKLEEDLLKYFSKQEGKVPPKKNNKPASDSSHEINAKKTEKNIGANNINTIQNNNLAALTAYETKSNEKSGHESSNSVHVELSINESKDKQETEEINAGTISVASNIEFSESLKCNSLSLQKVKCELEKELENNPFVIDSNVNPSENCSNSVLAEESNNKLQPSKKNRSPLNNFKYSENDKINTKKPEERCDKKFKPTEKEGKMLIENEEQNYNDFSEVIPLPDEKDNDKKSINDVLSMKNEAEGDAVEEKEIETRNLYTSVQVAENSSVDSTEATRDEFLSKGEKNKHGYKRETSHHGRSPSPNQELQRSNKKAYGRSISPPQSKSPVRHKNIKRKISKSPDHQKTSSKQSHSPYSRRSKSPINRAKSPISQRKRADSRRSKSRSRSRSAHRSTSRNRGHRKYSKSPDIRLRRSRSPSRNVGRGNRSYRHSGMRNRSPELRGSFQRRNKSPSYRVRTRGRSVSRHSKTRSRSHSVEKKRRHRRQVSSSSSSSSSSSRSGKIKRQNKKNSGAKVRNRQSSSSSSSSSSTETSRSRRSNS